MKTLLCVLLMSLPLPAQVPYERIVRSQSEPDNWLTYHGSYDGHRYSALDQIHPGNVRHLQPDWVYQVGTRNKLETTPLVVDGIMYLTEPPSDVTALDTRTGRPLWKYQRATPTDIHVCCGQVNRGVALLQDSVFVATIDAHLVALDARTGSVRWDAKLADYQQGYSITAAPLAIKDKVITGMAGGEFGVRGFLDAYDATSGKQVWRFSTVPAPGEPGSETWAGGSWRTGSAATWMTGSYDPESNVVFWGTGNPGPDLNGDVRTGDNLFSECLLALDADTGKLKWYFQFTPHDVFDWDAAQVPVLAEGALRDGQHKLVLFPNRNGFYYVLDRDTGRFLGGRQMAYQTWAKGLDAGGRPIRIPNIAPSFEGSKVYPDTDGATNWFSPSYSPQTHLLYVAVREHNGQIFYIGKPEYRPGTLFWAGGGRRIPGEVPYGAVRALEPTTGAVRWEFKLFSPPWQGVLSTGGGLVFGGTNEGDFFALDAKTGASLWHFQTGAQIWGNPMSYKVGGMQHVAIASGAAIFDFALPD
jgi:alcohol dehydrogenase (cytochrome c)